MGILYFYLLPLLLFGTWFLLHMKDKQIPIFIFGWLFIAPLGSALTFDDVPNLQRTLILLPALLIIAAYGFVQLIFSLKKWRMIFISVSGFLILIHVAYYLHQYYVHSTVHQTLYRQEGYNALVAKVNTYLPNYTKAIITNRESAPAIFFLVYNKYDPARFQKETKRTTIHDFDRISFDRYEFSTEECPAKKILHKDGSITFTARKNILYVNSGLCPPVDKFHTLSIIKRPDHSTAFTIISL